MQNCLDTTKTDNQLTIKEVNMLKHFKIIPQNILFFVNK